MTAHCDLLIENVHIASMQQNGVPYGMTKNASLAINKGVITDLFDSAYKSIGARQRVDGQGKWLLPGFIDCHTHLVYGGNRATEFEQRLLGKTYAEIARQGGGIQSTVNATRQASNDTLLASAIKRAARLVEEGVTCIEVKSGYGLDLETEMRMLDVAIQIQQHLPVTIVPTYLGAHSVPMEFKSDPDKYIDFVCNTMIPKIADKGLASCIDVFCESIGFTPSQCEQVFIAARQHGLDIKAHVEQLSDLKGAKLAAKYGALSVDHVEYMAEEDVPYLKRANTVVVLLPGAFYYLNETRHPPVNSFREHQIPMALATDLNPGSSPIASILTILNMGCVLFGMTPEEALRGVTHNAAQALGLNNKGKIAPGMDADLCLWDIEHPSELSYGINQVRPTKKWIHGHAVD